MSVEAFKNHVTSASFSLTLSKAMVETLSYLDQTAEKQGVGLCKFMTYWGLKDRGLVEPVGEINTAQHYALVRLTETGKLVIPLLKASGLYKERYIGEPPVELPPVTVTMKKRENPAVHPSDEPRVTFKKKPTDAA